MKFYPYPEQSPPSPEEEFNYLLVADFAHELVKKARRLNVGHTLALMGADVQSADSYITVVPQKDIEPDVGDQKHVAPTPHDRVVIAPYLTLPLENVRAVSFRVPRPLRFTDEEGHSHSIRLNDVFIEFHSNEPQRYLVNSYGMVKYRTIDDLIEDPEVKESRNGWFVWNVLDETNGPQNPEDFQLLQDIMRADTYTLTTHVAPLSEESL